VHRQQCHERVQRCQIGWPQSTTIMWQPDGGRMGGAVREDGEILSRICPAVRHALVTSKEMFVVYNYSTFHPAWRIQVAQFRGRWQQWCHVWHVRRLGNLLYSLSVSLFSSVHPGTLKTDPARASSALLRNSTYRSRRFTETRGVEHVAYGPQEARQLIVCDFQTDFNYTM